MLGRGQVVDTRLTPVGNLGGVFIHGNYVEAILYNRTYAPMSEAISIGIELLMSLIVMLVLALDRPLAAKLFAIGALCLFLVVFSLFSWQNLGRVFDFFIAAVLLMGHMAVEHILRWKEDSAKYRALEHSK
jgi:CHASE2 domain-containing sensor protein